MIRALSEARETLQSVSEQLADASIQLLSRAVETHEEHERVQLAHTEKKVTKARRAVEKAIAELDI